VGQSPIPAIYGWPYQTENGHSGEERAVNKFVTQLLSDQNSLREQVLQDPLRELHVANAISAIVMLSLAKLHGKTERTISHIKLNDAESIGGWHKISI
jgi:hypothetical protein